MRILHLAKFYPPRHGGIERFTRDLAEGSVRAGHAVEVLAFHETPGTGVEILNGVAVTRAASLGSLRSQPLSPRYLSLGRSLGADILHLHGPNPLGEWAALGRDLPLVASVHSEVIRQRLLGALLGPFRRRALKRAFRIAVATPRHLELGTLQAFRARCVVIPYGVDCRRFSPEALPPSALAALKQRALILFVGRLVPYKGLPVLLEAMRDLPADLLVVGTGPQEGTLRKRAQALGIRVHWAGNLPEEDLPGCYALADVLALPSLDRSEMFGYAILEAMACARPVVSSDLPGPSWVNRHGETGLVAPPGDAGALREALKTLLADPARRAAMGAAGRERALRAFPLEGMIAAYQDLYRKAAASA